MLSSLFDSAPGLQGRRHSKYIQRATGGTALQAAGGVESPPTARYAAPAPACLPFVCKACAPVATDRDPCVLRAQVKFLPEQLSNCGSSFVFFCRTLLCVVNYSGTRRLPRL